MHDLTDNSWENDYTNAIEDRKRRINLIWAEERTRQLQGRTPEQTPAAPQPHVPQMPGQTPEEDAQAMVDSYFKPLYLKVARVLRDAGFRSTVAAQILSAVPEQYQGNKPMPPNEFNAAVNKILEALDQIPIALRGDFHPDEHDFDPFFAGQNQQDLLAESKVGIRQGYMKRFNTGPSALMMYNAGKYRKELEVIADNRQLNDIVKTKLINMILETQPFTDEEMANLQEGQDGEQPEGIETTQETIGVSVPMETQTDAKEV